MSDNPAWQEAHHAREESYRRQLSLIRRLAGLDPDGPAQPMRPPLDEVDPHRHAKRDALLIRALRFT